MNTPHTHPRATEMLYVVNGTISSGMITENGSPFIFNTVYAGSAMLFPKGSIHFQQNEGCGTSFSWIPNSVSCMSHVFRVDPIMFVSALNNEDPGVESLAQRCKCAFLSKLEFVSYHIDHRLRAATGRCIRLVG